VSRNFDLPGLQPWREDRIDHMNNDCDFLGEAAENETDPTASGIVQCLRMLADEAASLRMGRTLAALCAAIDACAAESDQADITGPLLGSILLH
jgi:hypothetical protein